MTARGFGGVVRSPRLVPAGGGGGVTGAQNGLSLVGANVELGGANPLLHNTQIEMGGFLFRMLEGGDQNFSINPNTEWLLGDINSVGNGTFLQIDDPQQLFQVNSGGGQMLLLDQLSGLYGMGDILGLGNGVAIAMDDNLQTILLSANTVLDAGFTLDGTNQSITGFTNGNQSFLLDSLGAQYIIGPPVGVGNGTNLTLDDLNTQARITSTLGGMLLLDQPNGIYRFGDLNSIALNTILLVFDPQSLLEFAAGGQRYLSVSGGTGLFEFGDIDNSVNGNNIVIDDTLQFLLYENTSGQYLLLDVGNSIYSMGDLGGGSNGSQIQVNDFASTLNILNNTNTMGIMINGVPGFTGTVTPVVSITVNNGIVTNVA